MASIADVERLLERVFERSTARVFRTAMQPVQVERRVERAMEQARRSQGGRTTVPGRYRVRLHPADLEAAAGSTGGAQAFAVQLADAALRFARAHEYHLPARPVVSLVAEASLARGQVEVDAVAEAPVRPAAPPSQAGDDGGGDRGASPPGGDTADRPRDVAPPRDADHEWAGIRGDGSETLVFRRPLPPPAHAVLRQQRADGTERTIEVDSALVSLGRARDNTIVVEDPRVSRHHGRLQARRGTLVYTDLGSTNGSRVNGVRVDEIVLGAGDRLEMGDTVLVVETLPG